MVSIKAWFGGMVLLVLLGANFSLWAKDRPRTGPAVRGEVTKVDLATGRITIKHGPISSLGMNAPEAVDDFTQTAAGASGVARAATNSRSIPRNEKRCSRAFDCRNPGHRLVLFGVEHIDDAFAAAHINPAAPVVEEHVVGICTDRRRRHDGAVRCRESNELRWIAKCH